MNHSPDYETCVDIMHALGDYLSRELSPAEMEEVEEHLQWCELCMNHYRFEKALTTHIRERAQALRAPETLRKRVLHLLDSA
ncbi:MAG TPA: zf-HC2 domain-containing protein [Armatimonadota bacterium]|nr:zf-HC2 domain-containing protein [Armatimonadota bacterium]HOM80259.1 zf-HC2 domain-containing protein [Armatimonadota bacterium]HPO73180.1 zf-HC2 domain-containing protein [Armatimonadota bacterium]HPT96756.1 zf-HC2 domain-containing protein [Armatimonadota bacterium]